MFELSRTIPSFSLQHCDLGASQNLVLVNFAYKIEYLLKAYDRRSTA